ncbi:MAG: cytochrome c [Bacteroidales bacterium]|nr:cytochrome c [Bacteroidales bacterium]
MKRVGIILKLLVLTAIVMLFVKVNPVSAQSKPKPWPVPAADKAKKPSVKLTDATVIATGKELWMKHCKSCHGSKGLGDGAKAATLKTLAGDFSTADFQKSTDGELYYRVAVGRDEMPAYNKKVPDADDMWSLVAFMRTMKK